MASSPGSASTRSVVPDRAGSTRVSVTLAPPSTCNVTVTGTSAAFGFAISRSSSKKSPVAPSARKYVRRGVAVTVSRNGADTTDVPSDTWSVMVVSPTASATGVMVSVRDAPLPPSTRPLSATTASFEEAADTTSASGTVSASFTVKTIGPSGWSSAVVWSGGGTIMGGWSGASQTPSVISSDQARMWPMSWLAKSRAVSCQVPLMGWLSKADSAEGGLKLPVNGA